MSFTKIAELAEQFIAKIAAHEGQEPEDVKAKDLDWLDEQSRAEIKFNGKSEEYQPFDKSHNPPSTILDKKLWSRAKKTVKKYWKRYDEPWAVVYDVYRKMGGKAKKAKKK
jgi:hypothetical protein